MRDHRRLHQARQHRIDPDVLPGEFDRRGARHLVHRGLGGGVGDVGHAGMPDRGDRGDVDDRAAALPHHHGNHVLHGEERALEVDREDAVPLGFRDIDHAAHLGDADIVVEHVDAAVGLQASRDHRLDIPGAGDVGGEGGGLAAFAGDDLHRLFGGGVVAVDAEHLRALARKGHRGPARPDRAGADHQRGFSLEPIHRRLPHFLIVKSVVARMER